MEYNLVKLEELRRVTSTNDDDLILLSNIDTGDYQSTHMTVADAFSSENLRLTDAVRQSFTNLRDTSCIDLNIDESSLKTQKDANQAILDIFNTFGTHICELESAVTEPFVIIDSSEPDTADLEDGWLWADSSGYTSYDLYVLDNGNWVPVSVNGEDVEVNLGYIVNGDNPGTVTNTAGTDAEIPIATDTTAGLFTGVEKQKLEGIEEGAQVNVIEEVNLGYTPAADKGTVTNTAGTDAVIPLADITNNTAGLFTGAEKEKLDKIEEEAQKNVQSDWTETDSTADSFIQNKPNLGSSYTESPTDGKVKITLGSDSTEVTLPARTDDDAGLMLPEDKHELDALSGAINIDAYTGDLDLSIGELNNVNDNADNAIPGNVLVYDGDEWVAKDFEFESGTNFRGTIDLTTDDPAVPGTINPDPPEHGDIYINVGVGQVNDKWDPNIRPGMDVAGGEYVVFVDDDGYGGSPGQWEIVSVSGAYVLKAGDTMTGQLFVPVLQVGPDSHNNNLAIIDFKNGNDLMSLEGKDDGIYYDDEQLLSKLQGAHSLIDYEITTNSLTQKATIELVNETQAGLMSPDMYEMLLDAVDDAYDQPLEMVYYGLEPPEEAPTGALFTDEDTLKQFVCQEDGVWVEISSCTGGEEVGSIEEPWIRIDEVRNTRNYSSLSLGGDDYVAKVLIYDYHYNDQYKSDLTYEWEWDEIGDGNWVSYDPDADPNANTTWLDSSGYIYYLWSPEGGSGYPPMDPAHPHPCAKLRVRMTNTWSDQSGAPSKTSNWYEVWIAKEGNPGNNYPHQPPAGGNCPTVSTSNSYNTRKIDFPDVDDYTFDPDVPFEAPNGNSYTYNGYGWELVCGGVLTVVDLGYKPSPDDGTITNDSGTDATIPLVDDTNAGLMSPEDRELLYSLIPDAYEDDGYVKITGDVMSGSLDTPELILSDQSVTATPGNVSGILGPLQEPDIDADRDIFDNLTIGTMPGNGTEFYNNKQLPLIINNYFYYLAYKWANPKGAYISDQPLEGLNGPSDMTKLDNALYPHTKELERVKCGVDYENDMVYILFFGEVDANAELRYELYRGVYSTLHETGWKLVKGGSFSSKVITADYSDHHKVFLLRLYDKKVVTVDTKGDLSNTKYSSTKSFYLGNRIQSFGEYSYFLDDTKLVSSNDLFETFEVTEVKNGILLWTPVVHIIYKQRHYFWYDTECKSLDGNLDPDSLLDHPGIGVQANPKDYLTIATDYILYTTVNGEVLYFDGDQTYIDLGQGPTGTTPIDIFAYEPSTGGSYHYFSPGTNDKYDFYINGIPKNALIQPPMSGSGPHLLFNGERVALYKEIDHVDHTLKLELEFDHEFDGFYYRTIVTRNEHSEFAHYEWKWEIDLDGSGTIDATITEAFNTLSDTEKTDLGFVDASSYLLRCTDNSNYPNAKVKYTGTVTFGEIIDNNGDRVPNDLEKPALNLDSGTNQISLWGNP